MVHGCFLGRLLSRWGTLSDIPWVFLLVQRRRRSLTLSLLHFLPLFVSPASLLSPPPFPLPPLYRFFALGPCGPKWLWMFRKTLNCSRRLLC